jgi:solute carrier family 25 (mitochondrial phosphate transporter), member 23/24/25/41
LSSSFFFEVEKLAFFSSARRTDSLFLIGSWRHLAPLLRFSRLSQRHPIDLSELATGNRDQEPAREGSTEAIERGAFSNVKELFSLRSFLSFPSSPYSTLKMPSSDKSKPARRSGSHSDVSSRSASGELPCSTSASGDSMLRRQQRHRQRRRRRLPAAAATAVAAVDLLFFPSSSSYFASATSSSSSSSSLSLSPLLAFLGQGRRRRRGGNDDSSDSEDDDDGNPSSSTSLSLPALLARRPDALLAAAVPRAAVLFGAGAAAGALGKTITAPLDRVKLLLQTSGGFETGAIAVATRSPSLSRLSTSSLASSGAASVSRVVDALAAIGKQEGFSGYWKGNLPQILKVIPYSATQLCAYEFFKKALTPKADAENGNGGKNDGGNSGAKRKPSSSPLSVRRRLAAGAAAGMVATLVTHPLDTLRLRMAVDPAAKSLPLAIGLLAAEGARGGVGAGGGKGVGFGAVRAFYRGLGASLVGIAPYMAIELSTFDLLAGVGAGVGAGAGAGALPPFARGLMAAGLATTLCYPLDTARRRVQLGISSALSSSLSSASSTSSSAVAAAVKEGKLLATALALAQEEGVLSLYRGFLPSCLKNLPNKGVKLSVFDRAKRALAASEAALAEERARVVKEREERRRRRKKNGGLLRLFGGGGGEKKNKAILH